jgi:hypothetical protein
VTATRRLRGDVGQVGGIEAIPFGLLVFVAGSLLIANAWAVVDAKFATDAAAHQAARTFSESTEDGAMAQAIEAGLATIEGHGRDRDRATVRPGDGTTFARCARAEFVATYRLPALTVPFLGGVGGGIEVTSRASELVDPFRADVPGEVDGCG